MASTSTRGRGGSGYGRILPHQRDTDNASEVIGNHMIIADYDNEMHTTMHFSKSDNTRKNYRQRIKKIISYWKNNHPQYYLIGVRKVSQEELTKPSLYFYNKYCEDIIYSGLNYKFVLEFLSKTKVKNDGNIKSFEDIRKYKDAILWGSIVRGERLPIEFHEEIEKFLADYKKCTVRPRRME